MAPNEQNIMLMYDIPTYILYGLCLVVGVSMNILVLLVLCAGDPGDSSQGSSLKISIISAFTKNAKTYFLCIVCLKLVFDHCHYSEAECDLTQNLAQKLYHA
jgi:hypothetical protein